MIKKNTTIETIAIDFDGTCVTNEFPNVGFDIPGAEETLTILGEKYNLILWTCRDGKYLDAAIKWFEDRNIKLHGVNRNRKEKVSNSPKIYFDICIDDRCIGVPKIDYKGFSVVDWKKINKELINLGYLDV
jgi:hypothetical protein